MGQSPTFHHLHDLPLTHAEQLEMFSTKLETHATVRILEDRFTAFAVFACMRGRRFPSFALKSTNTQRDVVRHVMYVRRLILVDRHQISQTAKLLKGRKP